SSEMIYSLKAKVEGAVTSLDFGSLAKDTKMRKVWAMKKIVNVMASLIAPNDEEELMQMYLQSVIPNAWRENSDPNMDKIFEEVANQYENTDDRRTREVILSSIANVIGPTKLQTYIPGLSSRKYHNAKLRARSSVPFEEPPDIIRTRYHPERLSYFITFITRPIVPTGLPYGERKVKTSDGTSLSIPNTIRLHQHAEIIRMYRMCGIVKGKLFENLSGFTRNLLRHLDIGKHKIRPEKIHLYDCALQLFKQKLEGIQTHNNTLKEVAEAMSELANGVEKFNEG
ncbi:hypothetical protein PENTCL1PPCAC_1005, partial [Pristionchus entomophagus]